MDLKEFSEGFDSLLDSYKLKNTFGEDENLFTLKLDEYEKSLFLTQTQEELVYAFYTGKNPLNESYERTEEMRRYLASLNRTIIVSGKDLVATSKGAAPSSVIANIKDDNIKRLMFITLEQCQLDDPEDECTDGTWVDVIPVKRDIYPNYRRNPFRTVRVFRIDEAFDRVELIYKKPIKAYKVSFLSRPTPIILEDLDYVSIDSYYKAMECMLPKILHNKILEAAVAKAYAYLGTRSTQGTKEE
ncbi:MAG: hypothetical protein LBE56_12470 [Tannerella sp.]|jgi:hypothetical protein|nr:hypothetical protein [Tannerella sp.]